MQKRNYSKKQILMICLISVIMLILAIVLPKIHPVPHRGNAVSGAMISTTAFSLNVTGSFVGGFTVSSSAVTASAVTTHPKSPKKPKAKEKKHPDKKKKQKEKKKNKKKEPEKRLQAPSVGQDKIGRIASFYQGDLSYQSGLTWSGDWGKETFKKKEFGSFGCGLCCLANLYSSLSPYAASPLDMYEYAKKHTGYAGAGAIEWWNMSAVLSRTGFQTAAARKPKEYEDFQKLVAHAKATVVLVSSKPKKSMWEDTTGHYVTLFLYDKKTDQVFLADSGSYKRNRHWVPLKKIYQSIKPGKEQRIMTVSAYRKKQDSWRNKKFTGKCILPSDWKLKITEKKQRED